MFKSAHELVQEARKSIKECLPAEIHDKMAIPDTLLVDVREPDEYQQGHLSGAENIPRGLLEFKISNEPTLQNLTRPIIVYCKNSGRAALSVVAMQAMGFKNVVSLAGGIEAWVADDRAVDKPRVIAFE
ncbi:rhodanese-like domain-containing protein [Propionivibrio sp.]|uniref:rhodanese-like domain-containing protein n=1 Tax=Propionivibrio sp. TaxID=2212460 RepID=UPI003BF35706